MNKNRILSITIFNDSILIMRYKDIGKKSIEFKITGKYDDKYSRIIDYIITHNFTLKESSFWYDSYTR